MNPGTQSVGGTQTNLLDNIRCLSDQAMLAELFLGRLKRALLLRFYTETQLSPGDRRLLDRIIYSSFRDCQEAEVALEARRLIAEARGGIGLFRHPTSREPNEHI